MEFQDVVRRRRMVRSFDDRPLPAEVVERIVANGLRGPSAGFTQGVEMVVLEGREQTGRYWSASRPGGPGAGDAFAWPGLVRAPLLVVVVSSEDAYRARYAEADKRGADGWDVPWWHVDAAFAAMLVLLTAVDAGLGALFFRTHRPHAVGAALGIPPSHTPVGTVAVGHPAADRPSSSVTRRPRRPRAETVHRGRW